MKKTWELVLLSIDLNLTLRLYSSFSISSLHEKNFSIALTAFILYRVPSVLMQVTEYGVFSSI